jgi:NH3-dependent NAD+ synthetase
MSQYVQNASTPRRINPKETFESIVAWVEDTVKRECAPGLIMGISGTDSILTFLACASAFEKMGKPERVVGVNFQHESKNTFVASDKPFSCIRDEFNWVTHDVFPWLKLRAPYAILEIDDTIKHSDDNMRWGCLFSRALNHNDPHTGLTNRHFFPVGTRNATEQALGTYTQLSSSVSMLPIIGLYKSEVIEVCEYLSVPAIAIQKSKVVDCDCGRFDVQANHMRDLDLFIMHKQGLLSHDYIQQNIQGSVLNAIREFYVEETEANAFRTRTPYKPSETLIRVL